MINLGVMVLLIVLALGFTWLGMQVSKAKTDARVGAKDNPSSCYVLSREYKPDYYKLVCVNSVCKYCSKSGNIAAWTTVQASRANNCPQACKVQPAPTAKAKLSDCINACGMTVLPKYTGIGQKLPVGSVLCQYSAQAIKNNAATRDLRGIYVCQGE